MSVDRVLIAPSILAADFTKLGDEIGRVEEAGADMIHVDVMDGHFVPNITLGPVVVEAVRRATTLPIDVHLMIADPKAYVPRFIDAGADYVVFHREACNDVEPVIDEVRRRGAKVGLAVNPPNPATWIEPYLTDIDMALVMTVNPGFSGQAFLENVMPKLEVIAGWKEERGLAFMIEVDGGIGPGNVGTVVRRGGEVIVAASAIFGADDPGRALGAIRRAAEMARG